MVFELWEPALTVLVPAEKLRKYFPLRNIICERFKDEKDDYQRFYPAVAFADYGAVSSQIREINAKKYKDAKMRYPEEYPEIEPPEDERGDRPVPSLAEAVPYAASKKAAKPGPSDPEQSMASHSEALLEMQDSAKKRRAKLLEKESKQKAIDVDEESASKKEGSASKKARGKGQGSPSGIWTKEPLPAGHWQDRPRREPLPSDSQEAKDALRQKVEDLKKEEHQKKKLRETFEKHLSKEAGSKEAGSDAPAAAAASSKEEPKSRTGPGPDEAGSDPSSDEESESSSATNDLDGSTHVE